MNPESKPDLQIPLVTQTPEGETMGETRSAVAAAGDASTKRKELTREEEAHLALENTLVSRGVAWWLVLVFLVSIFTPSLIQFWAHWSGHPAPRRTPAMEARPKRFREWPQALDVLAMLPTWDEIKSVTGVRSALLLLPSTGEIEKYEDNVEKQSLFGEWILPRAQWVLTSFLGAGNEQAYTGAPGWLFYRPDIDYLIGPGFLDASWLERQYKTDIQPNPVRAIVHFQQQLQERGIDLLVMPVPTKATIHPEMLATRAADGQAVQNPSYARFVQALEARGIAVFDPTPLLLESKEETGKEQYLPADTHWTPQAMERVARSLTRLIETRYPLSPRPPSGYTRRLHREVNQSDIAILLKLPENQNLYPRQEVLVQRVYDNKGRLWRVRFDADILLLGDSFSNIYSSGGYWGEAAGLTEQLSYYLQRPLDHIVINGGGASSTREYLASSLRNPLVPPVRPPLLPRRPVDRLDNKRLVIYQFAARALFNNDWKIIDLPAPRQSTTAH